MTGMILRYPDQLVLEGNKMAIKGDNDGVLLPAHHGITDGMLSRRHPVSTTIEPPPLPHLEVARAAKPDVPGAAIGGSNVKPSKNMIGRGL